MVYLSKLESQAGVIVKSFIEKVFLHSDSYLEVSEKWSLKSTSRGVIGKFKEQFFIIRMGRQPEIAISLFTENLAEIEQALRSKKIKFKIVKNAIVFPFTFPFIPSHRYKKLKKLVEERCEVVSMFQSNDQFQNSEPMIIDGLCQPDSEIFLRDYSDLLKKDFIENPVRNKKGICIGIPISLFLNAALTSLLGYFAIQFHFSAPIFNLLVSLYCSSNVFSYYSNGLDTLGSRLQSALFLINSIFSYLFMFVSMVYIKEGNLTKLRDALINSLSFDHKFLTIYIAFTIFFFIILLKAEPTRKGIPTIERGSQFSKL